MTSYSKHLLLLLMLFNIAYTLPAQELIPTPKHHVRHNDHLCLNNSMSVGCLDSELRPAAIFLADHMSLQYNMTPFARILLDINEELDHEAYTLTISQRGIVIRGGDYGGVFNGITTLMQLLPEEVYSRALNYPFNIGCCQIEDAPDYEYRGFMLDVCRTWQDKHAVMEFIDLLAYHKINRLRLHLTDDEAWRIEIKSHPELAAIGGYRGGDSPIKPRYGKWNERWGGYYTQEDIGEIVEYAANRNIVIVPEIDLPGHSLCLATMHPEVLCSYNADCSAAFGYDTRSALCPSNEDNYRLLADVIGEICAIFPSEYIHIGGDEVEMSQWRKCDRCREFMYQNSISDVAQLQSYFTNRLVEMVESHGKRAAVWNEAIDGELSSPSTLVYAWENIDECRRAAAKGYRTIVVPGQYLYFDMKQSSREPGHDWAAIFDWTKVYNISLKSLGFTDAEIKNVVGFEATFFSEAYASRNPESPDYLHYQTFPRIATFAEVAWRSDGERNTEQFYERLVAHYARLDAMGVAYRLMPAKVEYRDGLLSASVDDGSTLYYRIDDDTEERYNHPIKTNTPERYSFVSRRHEAISPTAAVEAHFKTLTPPFTITSSMTDRTQYSFAKAQQYGRLARTTRAGDVGDWIMFSFTTPVTCRSMKVATGNFQLPRFIFENGYVEISYDGTTFEYAGELEGGAYTINAPSRPIKAVRMVCTSQGNGAEWVSIQPPTILPVYDKSDN